MENEIPVIPDDWFKIYFICLLNISVWNFRIFLISESVNNQLNVTMRKRFIDSVALFSLWKAYHVNFTTITLNKWTLFPIKFRIRNVISVILIFTQILVRFVCHSWGVNDSNQVKQEVSILTTIANS